jgi:hypothetical protein
MASPVQFSMRHVFCLALVVCVGAPLVKLLVSISEQDGAFLVVGRTDRSGVLFTGRPAGDVSDWRTWARLAVVAVLVWLASQHR